MSRHSTSSHEASRVVEFALKTVHANLHELLHPRVRLASKHILDHTSDSENPSVFQYQDNFGRIHRRTVILGITYYFDLEWDLPVTHAWSHLGVARTAELHTHRFIVTRDRTGNLYVVKHTVNIAPISSVSLVRSWERTVAYLQFDSENLILVRAHSLSGESTWSPITDATRQHDTKHPNPRHLPARGPTLSHRCSEVSHRHAACLVDVVLCPRISRPLTLSLQSVLSPSPEPRAPDLPGTPTHAAARQSVCPAGLAPAATLGQPDSHPSVVDEHLEYQQL